MREPRSWKTILFPDPERDFPAERWVRIGLRTAHLMSMAAYVGGALFAVAPDRLAAPLVLTLATGTLFALLEIHGTLNWLFEVRGLATVLKVALLALVPVLPAAQTPLLLLVLAIGSVSSHMPSRLRYFSLLTGGQARHRRG